MKARIGVIVYTHDRVDDARINLEILRNLWPRHFGALTIIHCYNGDRRWYPRPYLEDELIRRPNPGHFEGAADLLDAGMRRMQRHKGIRFVVGLAADTWLLKPEYVRTAIEVTAADRLPWATSAWACARSDNILEWGGAIDFFILDQHWADRWRMFPLRYSDFLRSYEEILLYLGSPPSRPPELEKLAMVRFRQALQRDTSDPRRGLIGDASFIHRLREREPIHRMAKSDQRMHRRHWWPEIGLATHHDPAAKQEILRQLDLRFGDHLQRLIAAKDLAYFNRKTS